MSSFHKVELSKPLSLSQPREPTQIWFLSRCLGSGPSLRVCHLKGNPRISSSSESLITRGSWRPTGEQRVFLKASLISENLGKADEGSQSPTLPPLRGREVSQMEQSSFFAQRTFMFTFERAFLLFQKQPIRGAPSLKGRK